MKPKAFLLQNKGMNRDLSVSKAGESSAYENHNIRILARDHDTLLSVTNERGNRVVVMKGTVHDSLRITEDSELRITEDELFRTVAGTGGEDTVDFDGTLIGWNVLNNHVILFTHDDEFDRIYRVDYDGDGFWNNLLFEGHLGFSLMNPIESVVYHETDAIQKIYWVDGVNVLRFMNFMAKPDAVTELYPWQNADGSYDDTYFDSNRAAEFGVEVCIEKDNFGNPRPNGVVQYLLTYYNKHGQETGYVWVSDLVYLAPPGIGGSADSTNNNAVTITMSNLDTRFDHARLYSIFRSSVDGTTVTYIVYDGETHDGSVRIVDDASHLVAEDSSRLLYLGSKSVRAGTLTHKDQTLFLGDLQSIGRGNYDDLETDIARCMYDPETGLTKDGIIRFEYSGTIPSEDNQLAYTSSQITTFKGGEKYRFALVFHCDDGSMTDAFWIGDAVNPLYPQGMSKVVAVCTLPDTIVSDAQEFGFKTVQLMIAEATYADRSVKAQGILCPTVFNVWERYNNRLYAEASWIFRPRHSGFAWKHFEPVHKSTSSTGEISCNYWETEQEPTPYYRIKNYSTAPELNDELDGHGEFDYYFVVYYLKHSGGRYGAAFTIARARLLKYTQTAVDALMRFQFTASMISEARAASGDPREFYTYTDPSGNFSVSFNVWGEINTYNNKKEAWLGVVGYLTEFKEVDSDGEYVGSINIPNIVTWEVFEDWCKGVGGNFEYFLYEDSERSFSSLVDALNHKPGGKTQWLSFTGDVMSSKMDYAPSYFKKHLMFVDENVLTLNSPEFTYEAVNLDNTTGYRLRIVGVAKVTETRSDQTIYAVPGKLAGENALSVTFPKESDGLISWPLWKEHGLRERKYEESDGNEKTEYTHSYTDVKKWVSYDYEWDGSIKKYWLHMWNRGDKICGFTDVDDHDYSRLMSKTVANLRYAEATSYNNYGVNPCIYEPASLRMFHYTSGQYVRIDASLDKRYYNAVLNESLLPPGSLRYPVLYSSGDPDTDAELISTDAYLYVNDPVQISYASNAHAVIVLPSSMSPDGRYVQSILPRINEDESFGSVAHDSTLTGALLPWIENRTEESYPFVDYGVDQDEFTLTDSGYLSSDDKYLFVGELYYDFDSDLTVDTRYGGITRSAVQNNRFIVAGPQYSIGLLSGDGTDELVADQGDTFYQRWNCLKTKPFSSDNVNNVIDIASVMLETHINIAGRTSLQQDTNYLASIKTEQYDDINPVYSQYNNFFVQHDLDEDFNLDSYRSSVTWSLEKHDSEDVDEWSHVTLANTLKLDGDKGVCQALRRMGNSIVAFQDRGISEILFNSRTQLSTQDGVPVEIANSGKVDGKRYITNKYGCTNKWSIVEGKNALYFVDNINKAFCAFNGQAIDNLSARLGFGVWFRSVNSLEAWRPADFNNIISYYDKVHSDVYIVRDTDDDMPCLVYNETLGAFTSFFDYSGIPMMANVEDRFVSYRDSRLWLQNEGLYCNFFGTQYGFWTHYRVTPEPYSDKIWTNVEYRADFYGVLDAEGKSVLPEGVLINGDSYGEIDDTYKEHESFTSYSVWDEYQTTGDVPLDYSSSVVDPVRKRFRIWRLTIPRALGKNGKPTLDRIRNPWVNIRFDKEEPDGKNLVQIHDFILKYFE